MKSRLFKRSSATVIFLALVIPVMLAATDHQRKREHHKYKLIDLGTFGGPTSLINDGNPPISQILNDRGTIVGSADTSTPDPYSPNCITDCFVGHAFESRDGVLTDLGSLPGLNTSFAIEINRDGLIIGISENGGVDPMTGFPEITSVLWKNGEIVNLGTLGGTQSFALTVNDRGQVVGGALNTTPDAFASSFDSLAFGFPGTTEMHAFLWEKGLMQDLGTLGGPDSEAFFVNERGQVTGISYTGSAANPVTSFPTEDPFLWESGRMLDLGSLGGTFGYPTHLNHRGQVAGTSNLTGDQTHHPFLWTAPGPMQDLGTLGGNSAVAFWANEEGEVVGCSDLPGPGRLQMTGCTDVAGSPTQRHHGFLWRRGVMTDLGTLYGDPCSIATAINSRGQIVGASTNCTEHLHGFLWENDGPAIDLNSLVRTDSGLTIIEGDFINARGEVAGKGLLPNGDIHAVLLIPCDGDHPGVEGCDYDMVDATVAASNNQLPTTPAAAPITVRPSFGNRPGHTSFEEPR